jgi:hypothetical protein
MPTQELHSTKLMPLRPRSIFAYFFQSRIKVNQLHCGTIEGIRNDWCALLARDDAKADAGTALTEILSGILDPETAPQTPVR